MSRTLSFPIALAACAFALPAPTTATPASVSYVINNHNGLVTVKDGSGKTLLTRHVTTSTILAILTKGKIGAGTSAAGQPTPPPHFVTVEDANGIRLWSTAIPVAGPLTANMHFGSDVNGMQLIFTHSTDDAAKSSEPSPSQMVFVIGENGRPVSMQVDDKTMKYAYGPNSMSLATPAGAYGVQRNSQGVIINVPNGSGADLVLTKDGKGGTINLNGATVPLTEVKQDNKGYFSFPWNGHTVKVENGCPFSLSSDGNLTINAPSKGK